MALNKERVKLWIEALRSGEFKQGKFHLRNEDGTYCCLGVACEVAFRQGVIDTLPWMMPLPKRQNGVWPKDVYDWLGFENGFVELPNGEFAMEAIRANDDEGWTFAQIADALEMMVNKEEVPA